jgi:hypothetical protein
MTIPVDWDDPDLDLDSFPDWWREPDEDLDSMGSQSRRSMFATGAQSPVITAPAPATPGRAPTPAKPAPLEEGNVTAATHHGRHLPLDNNVTPARAAAPWVDPSFDPSDPPAWWKGPDEDDIATKPKFDPLQTLLQDVLPAGRVTLTVEETAAIVGLGRSSAYQAVRRGDLPSRRVSGRLLVPVPELLRWLGADGQSPRGR